ncbi:hypothetical protein [Salibacterium lacus]|uniref:Uncharacterized protein n=1 Tax=Salibacterium lacus TaxID=1898109 RepID=A0ABW5SY31_9BACI
MHDIAAHKEKILLQRILLNKLRAGELDESIVLRLTDRIGHECYEAGRRVRR